MLDDGAGRKISDYPSILTIQPVDNIARLETDQLTFLHVANDAQRIVDAPNEPPLALCESADPKEFSAAPVGYENLTA